jgi:serine/threonine-protein kinase/endoribonuclease IRE1
MHPLFWTADVRLKFLCDVSDHVELDKESESPLVIDLEALQYSWGEKLDESFRQNIEKYRKYNFGSVRDLLRVIRNKSNHFRELPLEIQVWHMSIIYRFINVWDMNIFGDHCMIIS